MTPVDRGTVVFDLDGVLYLDHQGIPGAGAALEDLEADGWHLLFATNNSTKTAETVVEHLRDRTGYTADPASAITSAAAAAELASRSYDSAFVVGSEALAVSLETAGVDVVDGDDAGCVVVGLDRDLTYRTIDRAARLIRAGAGFIATNIDSTYPTPTGLAPGAGSIVAAVATASGVEPSVAGKPSAVFRAMVSSRVRGNDVWMIGDRPETDIALAIAEGWTSVLVLTGVVSDESDVDSKFAPTLTIDSVADLPATVAKHSGTGIDPR